MTAPPFMRWYPHDYELKTRDLTREEDGGYRLLLDACWMRGGRLPDDDRLLALITKCGDQQEWQALRKKLARFFKIANGFWRNKRLSEEIRFAQNRSDVARENISKRWEHKRKPKHTAVDTTVIPNAPIGNTAVYTPVILKDTDTDGSVVLRSTTEPIREPNGSLTPPPPKGGTARSRARGARRSSQNSPRAIQAQAFYEVANERPCNRDC